MMLMTGNAYLKIIQHSPLTRFTHLTGQYDAEASVLMHDGPPSIRIWLVQAAGCRVSESCRSSISILPTVAFAEIVATIVGDVMLCIHRTKHARIFARYLNSFTTPW